MTHTLIGQSEVLTISGTTLLLNQFNVLGGFLLGAGLLGGFCRYVINFHLNSQEEEKEEEKDNYEKLLSQILSTSSRRTE